MLTFCKEKNFLPNQGKLATNKCHGQQMLVFWIKTLLFTDRMGQQI